MPESRVHMKMQPNDPREVTNMRESYRTPREMLRLLPAALLLSIAGLSLAQPAVAAEVRYDPGDKVYFTYCYAHPPALRIKPGDSVEVHIDSIELNRDWGWGASIPNFGLLAPEYKTAMVTPPVPDRLFIWRLDKSRKVATLDMPNSKMGKVEVPIRPFFGTIGTAPGGKECISSLYPGPYGANMDFNEVVAGVTMQFPVFEPGALFMLGDGHSAQGDGEIDGAAIETPFTVKFTVNLIKGKKINWPHLINDNEIMSIGSTRPLIDALRLACADMVTWLTTDYGFEKYDAVELLGQAAHLYIANVVDPQFSVACALNKKYLPK